MDGKTAIGDDVLPSSAWLKEKYHYCPENGFLYYKDRFFKMIDGKPHGNIVNCKDRHGYIKASIAGRTVLAHRLIWAICYGSWPDVKLQIDHINRVRDDNRILNLRLVTSLENRQNQSPRKKRKKAS